MAGVVEEESVNGKSMKRQLSLKLKRTNEKCACRLMETKENDGNVGNVVEKELRFEVVEQVTLEGLMRESHKVILDTGRQKHLGCTRELPRPREGCVYYSGIREKKGISPRTGGEFVIHC